MRILPTRPPPKSEQAKRANALIDARLGELREQVRAAETRSDDYKRATSF